MLPGDKKEETIKDKTLSLDAQLAAVKAHVEDLEVFGCCCWCFVVVLVLDRVVANVFVVVVVVIVVAVFIVIVSNEKAERQNDKIDKKICQFVEIGSTKFDFRLSHIRLIASSKRN